MGRLVNVSKPLQPSRGNSEKDLTVSTSAIEKEEIGEVKEKLTGGVQSRQETAFVAPSYHNQLLTRKGPECVRATARYRRKRLPTRSSGELKVRGGRSSAHSLSTGIGGGDMRKRVETLIEDEKRNELHSFSRELIR